MSQIDWAKVRDLAREEVDLSTPGVSYDTICTIIEDTHDITLAGGHVEDAVGEELKEIEEMQYGFNPDAFESDEDDISEDDTDLSKEPVDVGTSITSTTTLYPPLMREREQWVLWAGNKQPRPPWEGHLFPAKWGQDTPSEERPTRSFEEIQNWQEMVPTMNLDAPEDVDSSDVDIGYILPPESERPAVGLALIDLDDVRDPETGEIHPKALEILESCGSYAEISTSGEGIHILVVGDLPENVGKVIEPIDDEPWVGNEKPKVEMYDHGRVVAMTGNHIEGTPTTVADAQDDMDSLVDTYVEVDEGTLEDELESRFGDDDDMDSYNTSDTENSPYWDVNPRKLVNTGGNDWKNLSERSRGPHPVHGSSNGDNFDVTDNVWNCLRCDVGGGPLHLVAMVEGFLGGECCDGADDLDNLSDEEFAKVCLLARDNHTQFSDSWKPPYRAIIGVGRHMGLILDDEDRAGKSYDTLRTMYDNMSASDL